MSPLLLFAAGDSRQHAAQIPFFEIRTFPMDYSSQIDVNQVLGYEYEPFTFVYNERDVSLYALGVGAPADWLAQDELQFVYELSTMGFKVLPTFPVIYSSRGLIGKIVEGGGIPGLRYNPMMLVHGEQYLELRKAIPVSATITNRAKISAVWDKGSGAVLVTDVTSTDESGAVVAFAQSSMFIRGAGGFGGERGPSSAEMNLPPNRPADATMSEQTTVKQALIYRLSGDINPLHADPQMAAVGNFDRPILHGLCTFGYAARAVLKAFGENDPARFKSIRVRFARHVFPGDTLVTDMWREGNAVLFRTRVPDRDVDVLSNAVVELA